MEFAGLPCGFKVECHVLTYLHDVNSGELQESDFGLSDSSLQYLNCIFGKSDWLSKFYLDLLVLAVDFILSGNVSCN